MTNLFATSTKLSLLLIVFYGAITIYRTKIKSKGSIKDSERMHRFLITISGILIGLSMNTFDNTMEFYQSNSRDLYFGILMAITGIIGIALGKYYLQSTFYTPLENISEFSAEFGTKFIGARLPVSGVIELQSFSTRFNTNALSLAHKISETEIQLDKLRRSVSSQIDVFGKYSSDISELNGLMSRSNFILDSYTGNVSELQNTTNTFIKWYESTQENLGELLQDLKSLTDLGNLIAVNAAIESVNMEVENPGFTMIAEKLHDLSKSLEARHDSLQRFLIDMTNRYNEYRTNIERIIKDSSELVGESEGITSDIDSILKIVNTFDRDLSTNNDQIRNSLNNIISTLPDAF